MAMGGEVDFPILYIVLNSWTRTFTGATLSVGIPAWLKHDMYPAEDSSAINVNEMAVTHQVWSKHRDWTIAISKAVQFDPGNVLPDK